MGLCLGSSWGESLPERPQKLSHKQSCDLTRSGLMGLKVVLPVRTEDAQTALTTSCSRSASLPFTQHWEVPLTVSPPFLVTVIQCLIINYFTKWGTSLYCIQSRLSAQLWSEPDESTEASSLSHLQSLFFLCWILNTLELPSSNVRVPRPSLLSLNLPTTNMDSGPVISLFFCHITTCDL